MIGRLIAMLQDTDYRVRLFLGRKIGILFQTWDGHDELFHDIWYVFPCCPFLSCSYLLMYRFPSLLG